MLMKVKELIRQASLNAGIKAATENLTAQESNDALVSLNLILNKNNSETLMLFSKKTIEATLTNTKSVYTVGPGADIDIDRPTTTLDEVFFQSGDYNKLLRKVNSQDFYSQNNSNLTNNLPDIYYYNNAYPQAQISFFPKPTSGSKILITYQDQIKEFTSTNEELSIPPNYLEYLIFNLAFKMCVQYGQPVPEAVREVIQSNKMEIQSNNGLNNLHRMDMGCMISRNNRNNGYNRIYSGDF